MRTQSPDTHPEIEAILVEACRRMTGAQKLANVRALNQAGQRLQLAYLRRRYPEADEHELTMRLASRSLGPELMRKAFGWDVEAEGY